MKWERENGINSVFSFFFVFLWLKSNSIINTSELRAEVTETGYNLVDYSGFKVFYLYATSLDTVFLASKDIYKGVLFKKNNGWFFEYDFDGKVYSEKVEVKF